MNKEELLAIAQRNFNLETLQIRGRDRLDFTNVHVNALRHGLEEAYQQGINDSKNVKPSYEDLMAMRFYEAMLTLVSLGSVFLEPAKKAIAWATETANQTDDEESVAMKEIIAAMQKLVDEAGKDESKKEG